MKKKARKKVAARKKSAPKKTIVRKVAAKVPSVRTSASYDFGKMVKVKIHANFMFEGLPIA